MTECSYRERLTSFESGIHPEPAYEVRILEEGKTAIEKINRELVWVLMNGTSITITTSSPKI